MTAIDLPARLDWLRDEPRGRRWLEVLPEWLDRCVQRWSLRLGERYDNGMCSLTMPATLPDGTAAVLKLQVPDRESEHEADALRVWAGDGAVTLLDVDREMWALLLERCDPGAPLSTVEPERALGVLVDLLPRLWRPAGAPFTPLADEAARWVDALPGHWERAGRPFDRWLLDAVLDRLRALAASQDEQVLLHIDLHAGNVLRAGRRPWLAIDPKPLVGERAAGLTPVIRGAELGHSRRQVLHRLDRLTAELGVDRERARGWAAGQTLAWGFAGGAVIPQHVEVAGWLLGHDR